MYRIAAFRGALPEFGDGSYGISAVSGRGNLAGMSTKIKMMRYL
jgi:hypothetical protein